MAVSVRRGHSAVGYVLTITSIDMDSSYPTGGEPLTAADLGFAKKPRIVVAFPAKGYVFEYDFVNEKLKAYASSGTEVTNATDLSSVTNIQVFAWGSAPS